MEHQDDWVSKNVEKVFECVKCQRQFSRTSALKEHMREHVKVPSLDIKTPLVAVVLIPYLDHIAQLFNSGEAFLGEEETWSDSWSLRIFTQVCNLRQGFPEAQSVSSPYTHPHWGKTLSCKDSPLKTYFHFTCNFNTDVPFFSTQSHIHSVIFVGKHSVRKDHFKFIWPSTMEKNPMNVTFVMQSLAKKVRFFFIKSPPLEILVHSINNKFLLSCFSNKVTYELTFNECIQSHSRAWSHIAVLSVLVFSKNWEV